jgi:RimJ/RimL family protein N-acetyltransferase
MYYPRMNEESRKHSIWCGEKVELRAKTEDDIPRYVADGVADDMRLYGDGYVVFPASQATMTSNNEKSLAYPTDDSCSLAVSSLAGELVGGINTMDCDSQSGSFEYGVGIFTECRRQGFALDAVRVLLRYYFEERRYHRATARVYSFNTPSCVLQEKLGFRLEGRQREMIFTQGSFHDVMLFGITADEFWDKWGKTR